MNENVSLLSNSTKKKNVSPWRIIVPLSCLTLSFGALYAPLIQFYTLIYCYRYYNIDGIENVDIPFEKCSIPEVQSLASEAQAIITFLTYGSTLLFAGYYGSLSDRKGRKVVFASASTGNILLVLTYILTYKYLNIFGTSLLFIGPVIHGVMGGDTVMIATAQAYISDCTPPEARTLAFGYMLSALFIGATIGPFASSLLLKQTESIISVFHVSSVLNILYLIYIYFFLPESNNFVLKASDSTKPIETKKSFFERINVFSSLSILTNSKVSYAKSYALPIVATIQFSLTLVSLPPCILYAMLKFGWTAYEGGFYVSVIGLARLLTTMLLLPLISKLYYMCYPQYQKGKENKLDQQTDSAKQEFSEGYSSIPSSSSDPSIHDQTAQDNLNIMDETRSEADIKSSMVLDVWLIRVGVLFQTVCFVAIAVVTTSYGFTFASVVQSISFLATPSVRSLITSLVEPSQVGQLLGAMAVVESFAMILSQFAINLIYSASVATLPELIFYICAFVCGVALILSFTIYPKTTKSSSANV